jgi:hypothetical protein
MTGIARALVTSDSPEWYTPHDLTADIATFLGEIDLDPCAEPERSVPAKRHIVGLEGQDGLAEPWAGRVFVNPPYGRGIKRWVEKALGDPDITECVLLVPARTDTSWFQPCFAHTVCFIRGRLRFRTPDGRYDNAPFPNALVYRGPRQDAFARAFAGRGPVAFPALEPVETTYQLAFPFAAKGVGND